MKLDYYVFWLDGLLGFQPSFATGMLLHRLPWLQAAAFTAYDFFSAAPVAVFAVYLFRRRYESSRVVATFLLNLFGAIPIYLLIPVCGPKATFPDFPFHLPGHLATHAILLVGPPPNCVPSVHTSTALLVFWFLRRWKLGQVAGALYVVLTVLATLGAGEHYLFDLVTAVPYTIGMVWLGQRVMRRPAKQAAEPLVAAA
jgi:hypothetical protein